MQALKRVCFVVLLSSLMAAQSGAPSDSESAKIQKLLDAMTAQQKAIADQQQQISEQKQAISQQQQEIEQLKKQLNTQAQPDSNSNDSQFGHAVNASLTVPNTNPTARTVSDVAQETPKESPLSFRIGGAEFTPGGFMDFTSIFRTTNEGTLGTNFYNIPMSNTETGHLTETRFTAQNSRLSLKATEKFGKNDVAGYVEMDFLGNDGNGIEITSNSHTLRERLYFVDVKRDKFEIAAGQMWSWMTPNRVALSPYTSDVFYSLDMDFNYQVGLTWSRQPGVHMAYHPNSHWVLGVGVENPEQFGGQAGEVTFPILFNAQLTATNPQIDQNNTATGTPNFHPDIIPKIAYDTDMGGRHFHGEVAGLLSGFKITDLPVAVPGQATTFTSHTKEGGGIEAAINLEVVKNFRLVSNGFWSDGGGRYIFGMAPDLVVFPTNLAGQTCTTAIIPPSTTKQAVNCDAQISLVHSASGIVGFEWAATPHTTIYSYYGGMYAQRNFAVDHTSTAATQPFVGFGGPNSSPSANKSVQEPSIGWIQTFWRNPQYGALQLITQGGYITRAPWFVAAGAPKNAHLTQVWVDLRYVLP